MSKKVNQTFSKVAGGHHKTFEELYTILSWAQGCSHVIKVNRAKISNSHSKTRRFGLREIRDDCIEVAVRGTSAYQVIFLETNNPAAVEGYLLKKLKKEYPGAVITSDAAIS